MDEVITKEIDRMYRVSDMLITAHSVLRDRFRRWALGSDVVVLVGSGISASLAFVDPGIARMLALPSVPSQVLIGLISVVVCILTLVQLRVDWSGKAALHAKAAESWAALKHELGRLKCTADGTSSEEFASFRARYEAATSGLVALPDGMFASLKKRHKIKVEISKTLDMKPGAWIWLLRFRICWRDNFSKAERGSPE